jgi:hypothetical protein
MGRKYGLRIYQRGVELRSDGRWAKHNRALRTRFPWDRRGPQRRRGKVRAWSLASARRLEFIAANADLFFAAHTTVTYRATQAAWETVGERNARFVKRCSADLHRFLRCLRRELGEYLWVREFQRRGVVHFHVLSERAITSERAAVAWGRASGQLHDGAVLGHGVRVDPIGSQRGVRSYVGRYVGKERQKELPEGVDGAGRWWGRSRGLKLAMLQEFIWLDPAEDFRMPSELTIVRILRRYLERRFKRHYRGGAFVDYGGKLTAVLSELAARLRAHYGQSPRIKEALEQWGWDVVWEGTHDERLWQP